MKEQKRPLILISNDDGYHAKGLRSLVGMIEDMAKVLVCAPESARSGFSCAFSATLPLTLKRRKEIGSAAVWSCNGTPVDCVKLALSELTPHRKPDLVLGGINHGDNASVNTHYSGTMGVALEGCMKGISAIAFSLCNHADDADFAPLRSLVRQFVGRVLKEPLPESTCLNVNFPVCDSFKGVRSCRMAKGMWGNEVVRCEHPRGHSYYWLTGEYTNEEPYAEDTDNWAVTHGYVAVTPTRIDVTDYAMLERIKGWKFNE